MTMRGIAVVLAAGGLLVSAWAAAPGAARAGVPRVCTQMAYDPLECPRALRAQHRKVLPTARLRALERQREALEAAGAPARPPCVQPPETASVCASSAAGGVASSRSSR